MSGHFEINQLYNIFRQAKGNLTFFDYDILHDSYKNQMLCLIKLCLVTDKINLNNQLWYNDPHGLFVSKYEPVRKDIQKTYQQLVEFQEKAGTILGMVSNIGIIDQSTPHTFHTLGKVDRKNRWVLLLKLELINTIKQDSFGVLMKNKELNDVWFTTAEVKAILSNFEHVPKVERNWGERILHQGKKVYNRFKDRPVSLSKTKSKKLYKSGSKKKSFKEHFYDFRGQFLKGFTGKKTPTDSAKPPSVQASDPATLKRRGQTPENPFDPYKGGV